MVNREDDLSHAGISPRERLQRIEDLLTKVDGKLDGKADQADLIALEGRVRAIEYLGAEARAQTIERAANVVKQDRRLSDLESNVVSMGRKLAYATGTISVVIVIANLAAARIIN
jgi:hypothetical protein